MTGDRLGCILVYINVVAAVEEKWFFSVIIIHNYSRYFPRVAVSANENMIKKIKVLLANIASFKKQRLSLRLLAWVVICSSFFALFMSAFQLYTDYRRDVASIHSSMQYINDSYLKSLAASAYNMDIPQLKLQLQGMLKLQDIEYIEIIEHTENGSILLARQGDSSSSNDIEREFNLNYFPEPLPLKTVQLSILRVNASLKGVYQRLWDRAIIIIVSNITKTFLASIGIFFIFQFLITRHLTSMARFARQLNIDNLDSLLVLDRKPSDISNQDELDQLVDSINSMQKRLVTDITKRKQAELKLIKSEEHLRQSQLYGKIGTWEANFITNEQTWSEIVSQGLGFPDKLNPVWEDFLSTVHPEDRDFVAKESQLHCEGGKEFDIEYRIIDAQQNVRWMRSIGKAEFDTNSSLPILMRGIVQEITKQKVAEQKSQLSSRVFTESREGIMITDDQGIVVEVNPAFCEITGYSCDEVINRTSNILNSGKQNTEFYTDMWKSIIEQGYWQGEIWNRKKDGTLFAELLSISSILDDEGKVLHYVGIFTDITHSKKQQETLEQMAHYDVLTQLPNRTLLADRFTQAIAHCKRQGNLLAVCFLDLDDFKPVNDLYGHEVGDELLVEVADRLKAIIRDEDTVSRQGGDEFALLLGDIDSFSHCEQMLKRIIKLLAQPYLIDDESLLISASIGVTLYPSDDSDVDTLMRHADQAMYEAKVAGRNRYQLFNTEQDRRSIQKTIRLNEIQTALENNEMCLYYQPKVNMSTGKVFGAEALIRWIHPEKGLIPPLDFLPIIEETDLEITIGNWVINNALQQLDTWRNQEIDLEVSVNISSYHLQFPSFIDDLDKSLALYPKVHSKNLQLEILESSALGDLQSISTIIKTCIEALGVNIALDDFGTGYSSLTHLRNLPAKTIKIDQTFVRDVLDDPNDYVIIDGVIGLANSFNREVIAEGVETTEHGLMLLVMGCNEAQGYGIARPMPPLDFQDWLTNYIPNQQWLSYTSKHRSEKEKKIKLFRLTLAQWAKHFENNINAEPSNGAQWPILKRTKCHCGIWIKRARQEELFEESWLIKLEDVHNVMHDIADDLFKKYHAGDIQNARNELKDINQAVDKLISVLGKSE